jgi:hypothetical protein
VYRLGLTGLGKGPAIDCSEYSNEAPYSLNGRGHLVHLSSFQFLDYFAP